MVKVVSIPPSEQNREDFIKRFFQGAVVPGSGFVMEVLRVSIVKTQISSITANIICTAQIEADFFMPKVGEEFEATVDMSRNGTFLAHVRGKLRAFFYSDKDIPNGATVKLRVTKISWQNKTYRAIGELVEN